MALIERIATLALKVYAPNTLNTPASKNGYTGVIQAVGPEGAYSGEP